MIYININTSDYENDVRVMTQAFYPEEKIVVRIDEVTDAEYDIITDVNVSDRHVSGSINETEKFEFTENTDDKKIIRNHIKRELYRIYSKMTGKVLPWGTLTGIRPVKIPLKMVEEGYSDEEIVRHLKEEYLTNEKKSELSLEVAHNEDSLLKTLDYNNGYSLYIGIPFCPTTCLYCSFTSYPIGMWKNKVDDYLDALIKELEYLSVLLKDKKPDSIYIGGGTPTTLLPHQFDRLFNFLESHFDYSGLKEFTVEAGRPDSIDMDKLRVIKSHGIDRISINPQTMNQKTLDLIGRRHTVEQIYDTYNMARQCGFENINMDLIVGLPGEDKEDVINTLEKIKELAPDNLTVHSLAIKRAARLNYMKEAYAGYRIENTDEIIGMTMEYARQMGMSPYYLYRQKNMAGNFENVGYAKDGKKGVYNILIMEEKQSIYAAGAGAQSKIVFPEENREERIENVKDVENYIGRTSEMIERKRKFFNENQVKSKSGADNTVSGF